MTAPDLPWVAQRPASVTDRQDYMRRDRSTGSYTYATRARRGYRAEVVRRVDGKLEYERCYHTHTKPSGARKCAEAIARDLNRELTASPPSAILGS